jgi:hypothetical protein
MPKDETAEITDDEYLLRRVPASHFTSAGSLEIGAQAFRPVAGTKARTPDIDGISLFRAACLSDPMEVLAELDENRRASTGVVRLPVDRIRDLGLTIKSAPTPNIPGHVVLVELNADALLSTKAWTRDVQAELAKIASEPGNIVLRPEGV